MHLSLPSLSRKRKARRQRTARHRGAQPELLSDHRARKEAAGRVVDGMEARGGRDLTRHGGKICVRLKQCGNSSGGWCNSAVRWPWYGGSDASWGIITKI